MSEYEHGPVKMIRINILECQSSQKLDALASIFSNWPKRWCKKRNSIVFYGGDHCHVIPNDGVVIQHKNLFNPSRNFQCAWKILNEELSVGGGFFSTNVNGWNCGFGEDEVIEEKPEIAITKAVAISGAQFFYLDPDEEHHPEDKKNAKDHNARMIRALRFIGIDLCPAGQLTTVS